MARFFKPLLGAVALAAATLTSTGAFAAYAYNAQITVTAPKGSTAEAAAKNKAMPTGVKYSTCAAAITAVTPNITNPDFLQFAVKYDAGKSADEIGDVYVVLQDLSVDDAGAAPTPRYIVVGRDTAAATPFGTGGITLTTGITLASLDGADPFVAKGDNLGSGAQTEVLLGGTINVTGLNKGLWAATVIIAKPGASGVTAAAATTGSSTNAFLFGRPETWAAHDTTVFELGTPIALDGTATLTDVVDSTGTATTAVATCE